MGLFKMMNFNPGESPRNHLAMPAALGLLVCVIGIFWLRTSGQPLIELPFRQSQTAMTALWFDVKHPINGFFCYETPEFGAPWRVPFEFPLYQGLVAILWKITGWPLTNIGRMVGALFMLLTLIPLHSLAIGLNLGRRFYYIAAFLMLCNPFYLYHSRMFMIESTAVFLGFAFIAAVERAVSGHSAIRWTMACAAAVLCVLVKITTFPSFGLAAAGIVLWKAPTLRGKEGLRFVAKPLIYVFITGIIAIMALIGWTHHADMLKNSSPITQRLLSTVLNAWTFGTLEQKTNGSLWYAFLANRMIPIVFCRTWIFVVFLITAVLCRGRVLILLLSLVGFFFLPVILFTNLHFSHPYYQFANAFWLILAFALALANASRKLPLSVACVVLLVLPGTQLHKFYTGEYTVINSDTNSAVDAGRAIREKTPPDTCILVYGDDWSPEVALYAERRSLYIPAWLPPGEIQNVFHQVISDPNAVFGHYPLRAVVQNREGPWAPQYSREQNDSFHSFMQEINKGISETFGGYDVYFTGDEHP